MKIVFFGTDSLAAESLQALCAKFSVVAVVTVPDAPVGRKQVLTESEVAVAARTLGLPVHKPESLKQNAELEATLRELAADVFVVAVYGKIIPQSILDIPPLGSVNVHPSLLPLYRGPAPIRTPLRNGDTETGVSIMLMDEQVDHGPLLAAEKVAIAPDDTNVTLTAKLSAIAAPLLVRALEGYVAGTITPTAQDHEKATTTKFVTKADGKIDWNNTAQDIYNQYRACQPWPGIYTTLPAIASAKDGRNSKLLKITSCSIYSDSSPILGEVRRGETTPGTVLPDGIVSCGPQTLNGVEAPTYLQILTLQPEGKQPMDIKSFLNGNKEFVGGVVG